MKLLKRILLVIIILIAIPLVVAVFVKNEYAVEREVLINKPEKQVFGYIKHLKNQDSYNKWTMMDPDMKKDFKGTDGTIGFIYAWDSEEAGKGEQEIIRITEDERLDLALRFIKPYEGTASAWMTTTPASQAQTRVSWGMKGQNNYPMNFMNLFMDDMLGADIESSLALLKQNLEQQNTLTH